MLNWYFEFCVTDELLRKTGKLNSKKFFPKDLRHFDGRVVYY